MLVLTRRAGEAVYLGEDIKVTMVRVRGGEVRLAIEAPRQVPVLRGELLGVPAGRRRTVSLPEAV